MNAATKSHVGIFISWVDFHGRSLGLAEAFGVKPVFLTGGKGIVLVRYIRAWRETVSILKREKPEVIFVQQPPVVALLAILATQIGRRARVIADLHTGAFLDPKWRWSLPVVAARLRNPNRAAIVTNDILADTIRNMGIRCFVAHDLIESRPSLETPERVGRTDDSGFESDFCVLVPLSYANDEPIEAILEAARRTSDVHWILTGAPPRRVVSSAPENVTFPGYVSSADYQRLLHQVGVILAPTTRDLTMQQAGYEAMSVHCPLITADFPVLRDFFEDSAVYVDPSSAESISRAVRYVAAHNEACVERMRHQAAIQSERQKRSHMAISQWAFS